MTIDIADISKNFPGTESDTIALLHLLRDGRNGAAGALSVIARPDQRQILQALPEGVRWIEIEDARWAVTSVSRLLGELSASGEPRLARLFSYSGDVLRLAQRQWGSITVHAESFRTLRYAGLTSANGHAELKADRWQFEEVCPLKDALSALATMLQKRGSVCADLGVRQTDIRPLLSLFDARMGTGGRNGMMSALVRIGASRGMICVKRAHPADPNPVVWLTSGGEGGDRRQSDLATLRLGNDSPLTDGSIQQVVLPVDGADNTVVAPVAFRSREMGQRLAEAGMGPFAEARPHLFRAMEELVGREPGLALTDLIDKAADLNSTEGASFDSPGCNPGLTCRPATVALKGRHSPGTANDAESLRRAHRAGESHPVGVPRGAALAIPGFRCAAPWAIESGPFGAGGLRPLRSTEGASFDSPGCNPGLTCRPATVALKGRHSPNAEHGTGPRHGRSRPRAMSASSSWPPCRRPTWS